MSPHSGGRPGSPDPERPARLGGYDLVARAGEGASSTVFQAREHVSGRLVALKVLKPFADPGHQQTFAREAQTLRRLQHPDIAGVLDAGIVEGQPWIALEWLPGHDLSRYVSPSRLLPEPLALSILERLALALDHAHRLGVLHRDVKPGNVRVNLPAGIVKLADFGVAREDDGTQTATGVLAGTPAYMAPEALAGAPASPATDLYALAVTGFELFTGRRPFLAETMGELLRQLASADPPAPTSLRPALPASVDTFFAAALNRQVARRPATGERMAQALASLREDLR